jgi:hypothetical protein
MSGVNGFFTLAMDITFEIFQDFGKVDFVSTVLKTWVISGRQDEFNNLRRKLSNHEFRFKYGVSNFEVVEIPKTEKF